jgi:LysM repeat protein
VSSAQRLKLVIEGLLAGVIVLATILSGVILSAHDSTALALITPTQSTPNQTAIAPTPTDTPAPILTATATSTNEPGVTPSPTATATPSSTPSATPTVCPAPTGWQRYIVNAFDTFDGIARRFNLSADQLAQANCLTEQVVTYGQAIYVPSISTLPTPTQVVCYPPANWMIYFVRPGDTLTSIAQRFNTSVLQLIQANCLANTSIFAGQILRVPPVFFTPTPTPAPSDTPTDTPTPTGAPTDTPTIFVPTDTPTPPMDTPTATETATPIPGSATPTETLTPTASLSPLPSITPTPSPSATTAPSLTPSPSQFPTLAPTNTPSATPTPP